MKGRSECIHLSKDFVPMTCREGDQSLKQNRVLKSTARYCRAEYIAGVIQIVPRCKDRDIVVDKLRNSVVLESSARVEVCNRACFLQHGLISLAAGRSQRLLSIFEAFIKEL